MKTATLLATLLAVAVGGPALAQTELNTQPPATPSSPIDRSPLPAARVLPKVSLYHTSSLGLDLGWGGPYGALGFSYARLINPNTDVNVGVGLGLGAKIGGGVRYFLHPDRLCTSYFGLSVSRTTRFSEMNLSFDEGTPTEEKVGYSIEPTTVLHLRSGLRWQPGRFGLLGTLGYGARLTGDPVKYYYMSQPPSQRMRTLMYFLNPGGIEISLGMSIGLGL